MLRRYSPSDIEVHEIKIYIIQQKKLDVKLRILKMAKRILCFTKCSLKSTAVDLNRQKLKLHCYR